MLKPYNPSGMVQPASRYSQGVEVSFNSRWLYISEQIGVVPDGSTARGLETELKMIVPALAARPGIGTWGQAAIEWLVPPKA